MATPTTQSVLKAFALLRSFDGDQEWVSGAEISRRANLPEASGYRLLQTLEKAGAIERGSRGHYRSSFVVSSRTGIVGRYSRMRDIAAPGLAALASDLDLIVHMGVLDEGMVTYIAKHGDQGKFHIHTEVGAQLEAYCSGLGKVLLAGAPKEVIADFLEDDLVPLTDHTITDRDVFRSELANVRRSGFAVDDREHRQDLRCVAVPILSQSGKTVAAISACGPAGRLEPTRWQSVRDALYAVSVQVTNGAYPARAA